MFFSNTLKYTAYNQVFFSNCQFKYKKKKKVYKLFPDLKYSHLLKIKTVVNVKVVKEGHGYLYLLNPNNTIILIESSEFLFTLGREDFLLD